MLARANAEPTKRKPRHIESHIQRNCLTWFRLQYPELRLVLFAIPNGGARNKREAEIDKEIKRVQQIEAERAKAAADRLQGSLFPDS